MTSFSCDYDVIKTNFATIAEACTLSSEIHTPKNEYYIIPILPHQYQLYFFPTYRESFIYKKRDYKIHKFCAIQVPLAKTTRNGVINLKT